MKNMSASVMGKKAPYWPSPEREKTSLFPAARTHRVRFILLPDFGVTAGTSVRKYIRGKPQHFYEGDYENEQDRTD